jgi:hypothetical protein
MRGSIKAVAVGQARATRTLETMANLDAEEAGAGRRADDVDTLIGVGRRKLLRLAGKIGPSEPRKPLLDFRKTTARRI